MSMRFINTLSSSFQRAADGSLLGVFRVVFGILMLYKVLTLIQIDFVEKGLLATKFLFYYEGLSFIRLLPPSIMRVLPWVLAGSAFWIITGWRSRWGALLFFITFSYLVLLDKSLYSNPFYYFMLISFLLACTRSDHNFSLRCVMRNKAFWGNPIPEWNLRFFQIQLVVVYFYSFMSKISYDWLVSQEPTRSILATYIQNGHWAASLLGQSWVLPLLNYGSMCYELLIAVLLLFTRTRRFAIVLLVVMATLNIFLFVEDVVAPLLMMANAILLWNLGHNSAAVANKKRSSFVLQPYQQKLVYAYIAFQVLFPLRHYFVAGNVQWDNIGGRFAWFSRTHIKELPKGEITFYIGEKSAPKMMPVVAERFINTQQIRTLREDPRMLVQFAVFLEEVSKREHFTQPLVQVDNFISLNRRSPQQIVNSQRDLLEIYRQQLPYSQWIIPME